LFKGCVEVDRRTSKDRLVGLIKHFTRLSAKCFQLRDVLELIIFMKLNEFVEPLHLLPLEVQQALETADWNERKRHYIAHRFSHA
jgi:hypothetical protein